MKTDCSPESSKTPPTLLEPMRHFDIDVLMRKKVSYEVKTGIAPTRLYLGRGTADDLYHHFYEHCGATRVPNERTKVFGLLVYIVDDYLHCEVA